MNCLTEALGLSLPGNGTVVATHADRELFKRAGRLAVELAKRYYEQDDDRLPRAVGASKAFENAMTLDIAMGGSTNTILHILAGRAQEAEIDFTMDDIDRLSRVVPQLCKVAPNTTSTTSRTCTAPAASSAASWASWTVPAAAHRRAHRAHAPHPRASAGRLGHHAATHDDAVKNFYLAGPGGIPRWPSAKPAGPAWTSTAPRAASALTSTPSSQEGGLAVLPATSRSTAAWSRPPAWTTASWCSKARPTWSSRRTRPSPTSWPTRSRPATWSWSATKAPRAARHAGRCSTTSYIKVQGLGKACALLTDSGPLLGRHLGPVDRPLLARRRRLAAPLAWCATATASASASPAAPSTCC